MAGRRRSCLLALDFHRDDGAADLLGPQVARQLVELPPRWRRPPGVHRRPYLLAGEVGDVRYGVLVGVAVGGEVAEVGNVGDEPAVAFAVDRRPVPDPVHALVPSCVDTRLPPPTCPDWAR